MLDKKTQTVALLKQVPHFDVSQLDKIDIQITRHDRDEKVSTLQVKYTVSIKQMLDNYTFSLGYNCGSLVGIFITLLTSGKVRVEFGTYIERLILVHEHAVVSYAQAMTMYDAYFATHDTPKPAPARANATQQIMVQAPRIKR